MAAHITAASADGPRYNPELPSDVRRSAQNGIWLCQLCAKLIDNDEQRYTIDALKQWKTISEAAALRALESRSAPDNDELLFVRLQQLMPDLLNEIRTDLAAKPLSREFVVLQKAWIYNRGPNSNVLAYYYDDHPELENKLTILENLALIRDITYNNTKRYRFTEALARYFGV